MNAISFPSGGVPISLEVTDCILSVIFYTMLAQYNTPAALWHLTTLAIPDVTFNLGSFYALRLVCRLWRNIIDSTPKYWSFFPLPQLSPTSFRFLHAHSTRELADGRRIGPKLTVFVVNGLSLGFFLKMLNDGDDERMDILHLWMDSSCWLAARPLLDEATFSVLRQAFFGHRELCVNTDNDDGWANSGQAGWGVQGGAEGWGARRINWNALAEGRRLNRRTDAARYAKSPLLQKLSSFLRTSFLAIGQTNFITVPFLPPPFLTTLHIRCKDDDLTPILMRLTDFATVMQSLPLLVELELWRVGFELSQHPLPIHHGHLRRLAVFCTTASVDALFSYLRYCQLDVFILQVIQEGLVDVTDFNRVMVSAVSLFTSHHVVESVGVGSSLAPSGIHIELYLRVEVDFVCRVRVPFGLAHVLAPLLLQCVPSDVPLSLIHVDDPLLNVETKHVMPLIPWPRFPHIRLLDMEALTDVVVNHLVSDNDIRNPVLIVLHRERGSPWQWHGGMALRSGSVRVEFLLDPGCCKPLKDERLTWTSACGMGMFSSSLQGPYHHLWRMMDC